MRHDTKRLLGLLERCLPPEEREPILGDLEELRSARYPRGGFASRLWYARQAMGLGVRFLALRASERLRPETKKHEYPSSGRRRGGYEMETLWIELKLAVRGLGRDWGFSAIVILTLTLAIGATTSVYSVLNGVLLEPLPFRSPEDVVMVWQNDRATGTEREAASIPDYFDFREQNRVFESMTAYLLGSSSFRRAGQRPVRLAVARVTLDWDEVLGPPLLLGGGFVAGRAESGGGGTVVLSESLWRRSFAADPEIVGQTLLLDDESFTILGVVASRFRFPSPDTDIWVGQPLAPSDGRRSNHPLYVLARLRSGATLEAAQADLTEIASRLEAQYVENRNRGAFVESIEDLLRGRLRPILLVLSGAVAFVLLIACANVANLMLARSIRRRREIALCAALGATPKRLMGRFLAESGLITGVSWMAGLVAGYYSLQAILASAPADLSALAEVGVNREVVALAFLMSAAIAVVFAFVPMLHSRRLDLTSSLAEGGRSGRAGGRGGHRIQQVLVVSQMSLALVLLVGAGLLINSLVLLQRVDPGFQPANVLRATFQLPESRYPRDMRRYPQWDELKGFHRRLLTALNESPGVLSAALTSSHPLDAGWTNSFQIQGREAEVSSQGEMSTRLVSDDYFATAGVRLLEGRLLPRHTGSEAPSLVLNKVAALRYFPEGNALGQRISFWGVEREVVGVVDNERIHGLKDEVPPAMYGSIHLLPTIGATTLMVRTDRDPRLLIDTVRRVVEALDPEVALYDVVTMEKTVAESLARERFTTVLLSLFAGVALALALVGVYSVLSNLVAQRRHEVGVRLTVGAGSLQILGLIVRQGMALATLGMALGLVASLVLSRFLSHLLYGIGPLDPLAYLLAIGALALTALLACLIPARRASKIDPVSAIRSQ